MIKNQNILFLCSSGFSGVWTRKHRFMKMLSEYNKVIFVERELSLLTPWMTPGSFRIMPGLMPREERINNNLVLYTPPCLLPGAHSRYKFSNYINQSVMIKLIKKLVHKHFGDEDFILWTSLHSIPAVFKNIDAKIKIFDCTDEISEFEHVNREFVLKLERQLIEICDIVFVTNKNLLKNKSKFNANTVYIPNGTVFGTMNSVQTIYFPCPKDLEIIPCPRVLFLGTVSTWTDMELIHAAARKFQEYNFVFIGPVKPGMLNNRMAKRENLFFLGKKGYESLPAYIQNIDVCISVFKINKLSESISPLKVYDYMATGKPVIATYMPELEEYKDYLMLYRTREEFFHYLRNFTSIDSVSKSDARVNIIKNNHSWSILLGKMCKAIESNHKYETKKENMNEYCN